MWGAIERWFRKLRWQTRREQFRRELAEELALHTALKLRECTGTGLAPEAAETQTRREMATSLWPWSKAPTSAVSSVWSSS